VIALGEIDAVSGEPQCVFDRQAEHLLMVASGRRGRGDAASAKR